MKPVKNKLNTHSAAGEMPSSKRATSAKRETLANNMSGHVTHDDRGNAIWEWAVTVGSLEADGTTQQLETLHNLALSPEDEAPRPVDVVMKNPQGTAKGYSPYDSGLLAKKESTQKTDLRKLSEWLKLQKQAELNKTDDK